MTKLLLNKETMNLRKLLITSTAVTLGACAALNITPSRKTYPITHDNEAVNDLLSFVYQDTGNSPELLGLISQYQVDSVSGRGSTDFEKALHLMDWTHRQWEHSGSNEPSARDAMTILKEAGEGQNFRCVEYGIVLRSVLAANGLKARTLALKTRDVESTRVGAGHVLTEMWSRDLEKWVVLDPQFNLIPVLDGVPLNAVEFQAAIHSKAPFELTNIAGEVDAATRKKYLRFIPHYLYYFDMKFDQRDLPYDSLLLIDGKMLLMLVPLGEDGPKVFQRKYPLDYVLHTHSLHPTWLF